MVPVTAARLESVGNESEHQDAPHDYLQQFEALSELN